MHNRLESQGRGPEEQVAAALLNDYLERVTAPLVDAGSYEERGDPRVEVRRHIEALAVAHEELGSAPAEAMRAAIRQFGEPHRIGSQIAQHKSRSLVRNLIGRIRPRLATAIPSGIVGALLCRIVDLSFVRSGLVSYDSGWFAVFLGLGMGFLTGLLAGGKRISLAVAALRGAAVFAGMIGALMLLNLTLTGRYPLPLLIIALLRYGLAGALTGIFSAIAGRLRARKSQATGIARVA